MKYEIYMIFTYPATISKINFIFQLYHVVKKGYILIKCIMLLLKGTMV